MQILSRLHLAVTPSDTHSSLFMISIKTSSEAYCFPIFPWKKKSSKVLHFRDQIYHKAPTVLTTGTSTRPFQSTADCGLDIYPSFSCLPPQQTFKQPKDQSIFSLLQSHLLNLSQGDVHLPQPRNNDLLHTWQNGQALFSKCIHWDSFTNKQQILKSLSAGME